MPRRERPPPPPRRTERAPPWLQAKEPDAASALHAAYLARAARRREDTQAARHDHVPGLVAALAAERAAVHPPADRVNTDAVLADADADFDSAPLDELFAMADVDVASPLDQDAQPTRIDEDADDNNDMELDEDALAAYVSSVPAAPPAPAPAPAPAPPAPGVPAVPRLPEGAPANAATTGFGRDGRPWRKWPAGARPTVVAQGNARFAVASTGSQASATRQLRADQQRCPLAVEVPINEHQSSSVRHARSPAAHAAGR